MLTVAVLGAVEVRRDGAVLPVPTGKTTELLVRLALDPGAPVRADVLVEDLWGEPVGRNTLQSKVSQLRRALSDRGLVRLRAMRTSCWWTRAESMPSPSPTSRPGHRPRGPRGTRLWPLAGPPRVSPCSVGTCSSTRGTGAHPHRVRLDELRMGLLEDLLAARVELGSGGDVVAELEAWSSGTPCGRGCGPR